ncbi:hypothetical protein [Saccharothrix sp. HUAS TT1]|uniref:hypothetical protein n=1 Tax=unclassified Saccharothrix TaxID=2593673 RepID=UPI00345BE75D
MGAETMAVERRKTTDAAGNKLPSFRAHDRGGRMRVRVDVEYMYTLEQAARALARSNGIPADRIGVRGIQIQLNRAASQGDIGRKRDSDDEDLVQTYRDLLLRLRVFPSADQPEDDDRPGSRKGANRKSSPKDADEQGSAQD